MLRLDRFLAEHSIGTRSEVKKYIANGCVKVNGTVVKKADMHIMEDTDCVEFNGSQILHSKFYYLMLNKPQDTITASKDRCTTVFDLIHEDYKDSLHAIGRLDKDTTGLLILTNDGDLTHRMLSPKKHVDKTYEVTAASAITEDMKKSLEQGVLLDDKMTMPAIVAYTEDPFVCHLSIQEGRFHQVKRMFLAVGNEVTMLKRISMGPIKLDPALGEGDYRPLSETEIKMLYEITGLKERN